MSSALSSFSVIIPARNAEKTLSSCLKAARQSSLPPHEIILVDDASTDQTASIAREFSCRIIDSRTVNGSMMPRFLGARHANCDLLIFIDGDVIVESDSFKKIVHHLNDPRIHAVTGILSADFKTGSFFGDFKNEYMNYIFSQKIDMPDFLYGSIFALRKSSLINFEPITEPFGSLVSDTELGIRLHQASKRICLDVTIQVGHLKPYSLHRLLLNDFQVPFCFSLLLLKYSKLEIRKKMRLSHVSIRQVLSLFFAAIAALMVLLTVLTDTPWTLGVFMSTLLVYYILWFGFIYRLCHRRNFGFVFRSALLLPLDSWIMFCGMSAGLLFGILASKPKKD